MDFCLLFFKTFGYFNDILLQKSLIFKEVHDFVTLSLAESKNKNVHSAVDLQNVEKNFTAEILCKLSSVKNMLKEKVSLRIFSPWNLKNCEEKKETGTFI